MPPSPWSSVNLTALGITLMVTTCLVIVVRDIGRTVQNTATILSNRPLPHSVTHPCTHSCIHCSPSTHSSTHSLTHSKSCSEESSDDESEQTSLELVELADAVVKYRVSE
jgi:hypothetical protein